MIKYIIYFSICLATNPLDQWIDEHEDILKHDIKSVSFHLTFDSEIYSTWNDSLIVGKITVGKKNQFRFEMGTRTVVSNGKVWKSYDERTDQIFIQEPDKQLEKSLFSWVKYKKIKALPIKMDIRDEQEILAAVDKTIETFGSLDVLVNNASAISLTGTLLTPMKRFDLMFGINVRGTFAASQACIPHLLKSENPHILNIASPLNMNPVWFASNTAYTMAKYGMSMCVLGMAEEFRAQGLAVNALWPKTIIDTAALRLVPGVDPETGRIPDIMADAAHAILTKDSKICTGNFFIDEEVLAADGVDDFEKYRVNSNKALTTDIFLD